MENGLYKVHFQTPLGQGAGVIVLSSGVIRGGDSSIYYQGTYKLEGDQITANVATDAHTKVPGMGSVLGKDRSNINLTGKFTGNQAQLTGKSPDAPNVQFQATLTKIAN